MLAGVYLKILCFSLLHMVNLADNFPIIAVLYQSKHICKLSFTKPRFNSRDGDILNVPKYRPLPLMQLPYIRQDEGFHLSSRLS